jgi:hypothetical protein
MPATAAIEQRPAVFATKVNRAATILFNSGCHR